MPPVTATSPVTNSDTSSDHVNVAVNASVVLIAAGTPIETVGTAASHVAVATSAEAGPALTPSVAAPCTTDTTTFDPPIGVTVSV